MIKYLTILLLCINSLWAQTEVGNGGNVLECNEKLYTQDIYPLYQSGHELILSNNGYEGYVNLALIKMAKLYPEIYHEVLNLINRGVQFQFGSLNDILLDSYHESRVPSHCTLWPAARFYYSSKTFILDERLWWQLRDRDRAALILHEYVYFVIYSEDWETDWGSLTRDQTEIVEHIIQKIFSK